MTPPKIRRKAKGPIDMSPGLKQVQSVLEKDELTQRILALKEEQARAAATRKKLAAEVRNAERRKARLRRRARMMTDEDLMQVLMIRKAVRDKQAAESGSGEPNAATSSGSGLTDHQRAEVPTSL